MRKSGAERDKKSFRETVGDGQSNAACRVTLLRKADSSRNCQLAEG
jgi:hypothetical protein